MGSASPGPGGPRKPEPWVPEGVSLQLPHGPTSACMSLCATQKPPTPAPNRHLGQLLTKDPHPMCSLPCPDQDKIDRGARVLYGRDWPCLGCLLPEHHRIPPFLPATEKKEGLYPPAQGEVPGVPNGSRWASKGTNPIRAMSKEGSSEKKDPQPSPLPHLVLGLRARSSRCSNHSGSLTA